MSISTTANAPLPAAMQSTSRTARGAAHLLKISMWTTLKPRARNRDFCASTISTAASRMSFPFPAMKVFRLQPWRFVDFRRITESPGDSARQFAKSDPALFHRDLYIDGCWPVFKQESLQTWRGNSINNND
jgi:hypothetical protein